MVKHVFTAGVGFYIAGRSTNQTARDVLGEEMPRLPAGPITDRSRLLK
jgi:hypothetical protein